MSNKSNINKAIQCLPRKGGFVISFYSMASLCEVLIDTKDRMLAEKIGAIASQEAWRIEEKYSRYNQNSLCGHINANAGNATIIDKETFQLLEFAGQCYVMSEGAFDITSGILRKAWHFDGSDNIPTNESITNLLEFVGWQHVFYSPETFKMKQGMEIDFGGIGKEYAVDRTLLLLKKITGVPFLVNYGGDIAVSGKRENNEFWQVGIDHPNSAEKQTTIVTLSEGAVATSGDANRFLLKDGQRYSHVLNVKTGWPYKNSPSSITVAAPQCVQAGFLATMALLQGENAEAFLEQQEIIYWSIR